MEMILVLIAGILMGAFNFACFCFGYYVRSKKKEKSGIEITEDNVEKVKQVRDWFNYGGVK